MNSFYLFMFIVPFTSADFRLIKTGNGEVVTLGFNATSEVKQIAWATSNWDMCSLQSHDKCGQTRNVVCISFDKPEHFSTLVSQEYCKNLQKPTYFGTCKKCTLDCIMTTWSQWSDCSSTCKSAMRYRTRTLLQQPVNGGKNCGPLSEIEQCMGLPDCIEDHIITIYKWKLNDWTSCRKTKSIANNARCSEQIGERIRLVECVDSLGQTVPTENCIYRLSDDNSDIPMPATREICHLPCNCKVSPWKPFSNCSKPCYNVGSNETGIIRRTREITEFPRYGGERCPHLEEVKLCDHSMLQPCPTYSWHTLDWQECQLVDEGAKCGPGVNRRQVYCMVVDDPDMRPVDDHLCTGRKPSSRRACVMNCPIDCELGEWENWTPCTQSCGIGGVHLRIRKKLREPAFGGLECEATVSFKECLPVNCSWYYAGTWSACFPASGVYGDCGTGTQTRSVYCKSALNQVLRNSNCSGMVKPDRKQSCNIPCPGECVLSEWTEWNTCSETCGPVGGTQMRTRTILAASNSTSTQCVSEDELWQSRICGHWHNCNTHHWQVYPWEKCISNIPGTCGHMNGTQLRKVLCEMDSAPPVDDSMCDASLKPNVSQSCDVICPIDCQLSMWSVWSQCSASCGNGTRIRTRRIFSLGHFGGAQCPNGADDDGIITMKGDCVDLEPCFTYSWQTSAWKMCEHIGNNCGIGLQTRDVDCIRNDGRIVELGACLRELLEVPPSDTQQCFLPCDGDCGLTEWGTFGPCQQSFCSQYVEADYCRIRSRKFIIAEGITYDVYNDQFNLCPHVSALDFKDAEACEGPNYTYMWQEGIWRSCIPFADNGNALCGDGRKWRTVLCLRSDGVHVPEYYCDEVANVPASYKACTIKCPQDCEVSDWTNWSDCSHNCGQGIKKRYRTITQEMNRGGRSCPALEETFICTLMSCDQFSWIVSEWSKCTANNSNCGMGQQIRTVRCQAGDEYEAECEIRERKPLSNVDCIVPCTDDCIFSEWTVFTPCPTVCSVDAVKIRTRTLVRQSSMGQPCGSLEDTVPCTVDGCDKTKMFLEFGEWLPCKPISGGCGKGTRQRRIGCHDENGVYYDLKRCNEFVEPSVEDCEVECTEDCVLGRYGRYSDCNEDCGMNGHKFRERDILMEGTGLGRRCPKNSHSLVQTMPCNIVPCYKYKFKRGEWSSCSINVEMGCGSGLRTRSIECRRSDGALGSERDCLIELILNKDLSAITDIEFELSSINRTQLDIHTSENCGRPCPGDCQVVNWSSFSPCVKNCFGDISDNPVKIRTRSIIKQATAGGLKCPEVMQDIRSCPASEAICPIYTWHTGSWNLKTKKRVVWCQDQDGRNVTGGCILKNKPISVMECYDICEPAFTKCIDGQCQCQDGFQMFFNICIPVKGCHLDYHCPLFSHCSKEKCKCNLGYIMDNNGLCKLDAAYDGSSGVTYEDESNIWIWIVIGVCFFMIIVFIVFTILIFRNYRRNALMKEKVKEAEIAEHEKMDVTPL